MRAIRPPSATTAATLRSRPTRTSTSTTVPVPPIGHGSDGSSPRALTPTSSFATSSAASRVKSAGARMAVPPTARATLPRSAATAASSRSRREATNLVRGDRNGASDVYLHDAIASITILVSRAVRGRSANGPKKRLVVSHDGRVVAFQSDASDLVCARRCAGPHMDTNLVADAFVYERDCGDVRRVSADAGAGWSEPSRLPIVDGAGATPAFASRHPMDARDRGNDFDSSRCSTAAPRPAFRSREDEERLVSRLCRLPRDSPACTLLRGLLLLARSQGSIRKEPSPGAARTALPRLRWTRRRCRAAPRRTGRRRGRDRRCRSARGRRTPRPVRSRRTPPPSWRSTRASRARGRR